MFVGCKKAEKKNYSSWKVNETSFVTNEVDLAIGKARCGFAATDISNRFSLGFTFGYELPKSGTFTITTSGSGGDPTFVGLTFYYNGRFYIVSPNVTAKLTAGENSKKARYTLPPTWYVSYESPEADSVLISGEFNEP